MSEKTNLEALQKANDDLAKEIEKLDKENKELKKKLKSLQGKLLSTNKPVKKEPYKHERTFRR